MLESFSRRLANALFLIAGAAIVLMMSLTCADVVLRLFRRPIPGTYELVCYFGAVAVAFAMAHTSVQKGHIAVSILTQHLPRRLQAAIEVVTDSLGLLLFACIAWQSWRYAEDLRRAGEVSLTLQMPFYPFVYGVGLSAVAVCCVLLANLAANFMKALGR